MEGRISDETMIVNFRPLLEKHRIAEQIREGMNQRLRKRVVHQARRLGCGIVKLFPAVSAGMEHWRRPHRPSARAAAKSFDLLCSSVLRFDELFVPVGEDNWEAFA
jgi:hypothetical protein